MRKGELFWLEKLFTDFERGLAAVESGMLAAQTRVAYVERAVVAAQTRVAYVERVVVVVQRRVAYVESEAVAAQTRVAAVEARVTDVEDGIFDTQEVFLLVMIPLLNLECVCVVEGQEGSRHQN